MGLITKDERGNIAYLVRVNQGFKIDLPPEGVHTLCVVPTKDDYTVDFGKTAVIKIDDVANQDSSGVEKEIDLRFAEGVSRVVFSGVCFPVILKKIIFPSTLYYININPKRTHTHRNSAIEELDFSKVTSIGAFQCGAIKYLNHLENLDLSHVKCDRFETECITSLPKLRTLSLPKGGDKYVVNVASNAFNFIGSPPSYTNLFISGTVELSDLWIRNSRINNLILGSSSIRFIRSRWAPSTGSSLLPLTVDINDMLLNNHIKKIWITAKGLYEFLSGDPQMFFRGGFFNKKKTSCVFDELYIVGSNIEEFRQITNNSWFLTSANAHRIVNMGSVSWDETFRSRLHLDFKFTYKFIFTKKSKWVDILRKQSLKDEELTIPDSTLYSPPNFPWK